MMALHVSTRVEESSELQELPEANDFTADRDVVDRGRVRHPRLLVDQVPPPTPVGHRTPAGGSLSDAISELGQRAGSSLACEHDAQPER